VAVEVLVPFPKPKLKSGPPEEEGSAIFLLLLENQSLKIIECLLTLSCLLLIHFPQSYKLGGR
jgi:hypothetical protein